MRNKLEGFTNQHLIKLNKQALKKSKKLPKLLDFLLSIDKLLPAEDFFKKAGLDLFPTLFKLTFYGFDFSVSNETGN